MDLFYPSVFFLLFLITILSLRKVIFPNLAWYLFVNPDGLDLWFPRDSVDQVHQLPILTEDPLLDPGDSAGIHSSLGDPAFINIINDDINADVIPGLCVKQIKSTINQMTLHLVLGQRVPVESSSCLNLCAISSCFKEWFSKFEIDRSWLEGRGGVDAHQAARQVLVGGSRVEGARNLWGKSYICIRCLEEKLTVLVNQLTPISYMKSEKPSLVSSWYWPSIWSGSWAAVAKEGRRRMSSMPEWWMSSLSRMRVGSAVCRQVSLA